MGEGWAGPLTGVGGGPNSRVSQNDRNPEPGSSQSSKRKRKRKRPWGVKSQGGLTEGTRDKHPEIGLKKQNYGGPRYQAHGGKGQLAKNGNLQKSVKKKCGAVEMSKLEAERKKCEGVTTDQNNYENGPTLSEHRRGGNRQQKKKKVLNLRVAEIPKKKERVQGSTEKNPGDPAAVA